MGRNSFILFFTCSPGRLLTPFSICVCSQSSCSSSSVADRLPSLPPLLLHQKYKTDNTESFFVFTYIQLFSTSEQMPFILFYLLKLTVSLVALSHGIISFLPSFSAILSLMLFIRGANSILLSWSSGSSSSSFSTLSSSSSRL